MSKQNVLEQSESIETIKVQLTELAARAKELEEEFIDIQKQAEKLKQAGYLSLAKSMIGTSVTINREYCITWRLTHLISVPATIHSVARKNIILHFSNGQKYRVPLDDVLRGSGLLSDTDVQELDLQSVYRRMFPRHKAEKPATSGN